MEINGTLRNESGAMVVFEARSIERDRWEIIAKVRGERFESITNNPSPWAAIEKAVGQALDSNSATNAPRSKYDMNKPLPGIKKAAPKPKRKIKAGDLPKSKYDIDLAAIQRQIEKETSNG